MIDFLSPFERFRKILKNYCYHINIFESFEGMQFDTLIMIHIFS